MHSGNNSVLVFLKFGLMVSLLPNKAGMLNTGGTYPVYATVKIVQISTKKIHIYHSSLWIILMLTIMIKY